MVVWSRFGRGVCVRGCVVVPIVGRDVWQRDVGGFGQWMPLCRGGTEHHPSLSVHPIYLICIPQTLYMPTLYSSPMSFSNHIIMTIPSKEKCGGHLVTHGSNGFTCPAGDFEAFYQATKRIVVDVALRKALSVNARQGSWKFERHKIMQQMLENYKDAIVRHHDPSFIKNRLQDPEAAGRNFMSLICCNYWFVKTFAEPFLNTSHNVQSLVHGTTECVQRSR